MQFEDLTLDQIRQQAKDRAKRLKLSPSVIRTIRGKVGMMVRPMVAPEDLVTNQPRGMRPLLKDDGTLISGEKLFPPKQPKPKEKP